MDYKGLVKVTDSWYDDVQDVEVLKYLDINNYDRAEGREVRVGNQVVTFTCMSDESSAQWSDSEEGYPYVYEVQVFLNYGEDDEKSAVGESKQWSSEDSAWYDGFVPAYKRACNKLGVKALIK